MSEDLSKAGILVQVLIAAVSGGLSYLLLRSALPTYGKLVGAPDEKLSRHRVGRAGVRRRLYRIRRGSWTREHVDELFEIDNDD